MIKYINGKRYNTDTSKICGEWDNELSTTDFGYCYEALYKKRRGEFFIYGHGGPLSKYANHVSYNRTTGGEKIIPLSYAEAKQWAELHLTGAEYEEVFGETDDNDDSRTTICLSMSKADAERLKKAAQKAEMDLSAFVVKSLIGGQKQSAS